MIDKGKHAAKAGKRKAYTRPKNKSQKRQYTLLQPSKFMFFINPKRDFEFRYAHTLQAAAFGATRSAAALVRWNVEDDSYLMEEFVHAIDRGKSQNGHHAEQTRVKIPRNRMKSLAEDHVLMQWDIAKVGNAEDFSQTTVQVRHLPTKSIMVPWRAWPPKIPNFGIAEGLRPKMEAFLSG
tara:strand:- start:6684 stop:7223 length:540 start_codon:yes stop_codon:yes gene_type:complete